MIPPSPLAHSNLAVDLAAPCWIWQGYVLPTGYGQLIIRQRKWRAHRYMWTMMRGPIPDGLDLDHLCRNRLCINPQHLEPVTRRENLLRGEGFAGVNARKTHCAHGHPFDGLNTGRRTGRSGRFCLACSREHGRKHIRSH